MSEQEVKTTGDKLIDVGNNIQTIGCFLTCIVTLPIIGIFIGGLKGAIVGIVIGLIVFGMFAKKS